MVRGSITQLKSWQTHDLSAAVVFNKLYMGKLLQRFSFAFSLFHLPKWGRTQELICKLFDKAFYNTTVRKIPKEENVTTGVWRVIFGLHTQNSFLCQKMLLMAASMYMADQKAGRIFRDLLHEGGGCFEEDVIKALNELSVGSSWK